MRTTIDRAGRIVIPKRIREEAGLAPGVEVEVTCENGTIEIEPVLTPMKLVPKGWLLVAVPEGEIEPLTSEDVERIRQEIYLERERRILGLE